MVVAITACGSDSDVSSSNADDPAVDAPTDVVDDDAGDLDTGDGADPGLPVDDPATAPVDLGDETLIPDTPNPVSGVVTTPTEVVANPDDDSELWVRFVGGDPNCTAAHVEVLVDTPDKLSIELIVGLTEDALSRSCMAGEWNLVVAVPLNSEVGDRRVSFAQAGGGDEPQLVTPDLTTDDFVGLTEAEAADIADPQLIPWRVTRVDGEFFAVTEDYNPGRLNFEIDEGVITVVTLG